MIWAYGITLSAVFLFLPSFVAGTINATCVTASNVIIVNRVTTLDSIAAIGGLLKEDSQVIPASLVCPSTQTGDVQSATEKSFIFGFDVGDGFSKYVRVYLELINYGVYVSADTMGRYYSGEVASADCVAANYAFANSIYWAYAASDCGIYNLKFEDVRKVYEPFLTTSPVAVMDDVTSLAPLSVYDAKLGGAGMSVPTGLYADYVCEDTSTVQTSTLRTYIFVVADPTYFKFVKVLFALSEREMSVYADAETRYKSRSSTSISGCAQVPSAFNAGSPNTLSTSPDIIGYGVFHVVYNVSGIMAPTEAPSLMPTDNVDEAASKDDDESGSDSTPAVSNLSVLIPVIVGSILVGCLLVLGFYRVRCTTVMTATASTSTMVDGVTMVYPSAPVDPAYMVAEAVMLNKDGGDDVVCTAVAVRDAGDCV